MVIVAVLESIEKVDVRDVISNFALVDVIAKRGNEPGAGALGLAAGLIAVAVNARARGELLSG